MIPGYGKGNLKLISLSSKNTFRYVSNMSNVADRMHMPMTVRWCGSIHGPVRHTRADGVLDR